MVVSADAETSFALLADVKRSGMHFPAVDRLIPVDDRGRWRWKIKEKGIGPVRMRAGYDAVYVADAEALTVTWAPPSAGAGDMESYGMWRVETLDAGSRLHFSARTLVQVPAPRIMKAMVEAFAREEMIRLKRAYLSAIAKTLNS